MAGVEGGDGLAAELLQHPEAEDDEGGPQHGGLQRLGPAVTRQLLLAARLGVRVEAGEGGHPVPAPLQNTLHTHHPEFVHHFPPSHLDVSYFQRGIVLLAPGTWKPFRPNIWQ